MSLSFQILGAPGEDNAVLLEVDSGQQQDRLLFDCGAGCLSTLSLGEIRSIDHLFFSHLHMDHVCGFDDFFRATYDRKTKPNQLWGPPGTARILHHRLQGYLWNLSAEMSASWRITDIFPDRLETHRSELAEAFATTHAAGTVPLGEILLDSTHYTVSSITLEHHTPVIGYRVQEKPRWNIDATRLHSLGLVPGPWMQQLKAAATEADAILINNQPHSLRELRKKLLVQTPGDSVAYLTDFLLDAATQERLADFLQGCHTIVCEGQYRHADLALALKHCHLTTVQSAQLASRVQARRLILFHLSRRYEAEVWLEMLAEARSWFPAAEFPENWEL